MSSGRGHEHLDEFALIYMNGRAYDYNLGRFYGVDPVIQFPGNSQSLNPYSYIMNNPLAGTDPTGYQSVTDGENNERFAPCDFLGPMCNPKIQPLLDIARMQKNGASDQSSNGKKSTSSNGAKKEVSQIGGTSERTPWEMLTKPFSESDFLNSPAAQCASPESCFLMSYQPETKAFIFNQTQSYVKSQAAIGVCGVSGVACTGIGAARTADDIKKGNYGWGAINGALTVLGLPAAASEIRSVANMEREARGVTTMKGPSTFRNEPETVLNGDIYVSPPTQFPNLFPETLRVPRLIPYDTVARMTSKNLIYVVRQDGKLAIGRNDGIQGHVDLALGKPVLAAGELRVFNGRVKQIDNFSGHYRPSGPSARSSAVQAFESAGFKNVADKYKEYQF
jgi:RHS repeat-associated protein